MHASIRMPRFFVAAGRDRLHISGADMLPVTIDCLLHLTDKLPGLQDLLLFGKQ